MVRHSFLALALLALLPTVARAGGIALERFTTESAWRPRADGGNPPQMTVAPAPAGRAGLALHLKYDDRAPHWGNIERAVSLPSGEGAISMWVYRQAARTEAKMHLILAEPDGDLWISPLTSRRRHLGEWRRGWHEVVVELGDMVFDPRGNGVRERGKSNLLIIGCNYADLEVAVADITFEAGSQPLPGWEEWDEGLVRRSRVELGDPDHPATGMLGSGWWEAEADGRWTGREGKEGALVLPAWPGWDYLVWLEVIGGQPNTPTLDLGARLAGKPLVAHVGPRINERWLLIPAEQVRGARLEITLGRPTFTPGGTDLRTLGAKVRAVETWAFRRTAAAKRLMAGKAGDNKALALYVPPGRKPERTRRILASWGYRVACLGPGEVMNPALLDPARFPTLVVMDDTWPARGKEAIIHYLARGGNLFTLQGYAFDRPLVCRGGDWQESNLPPRINTHFGEPRDALHVEREQVGAFDGSYRLEPAVALQAAPDQAITGPLSVPCAVEGWGASALVASNNPVFPQVWGRRTPLINAHDVDGRLVGAAVSLVQHHAGPWTGSSWLLCGVENRNLLLVPRVAEALRRGLAALARKLFVHDLAASYACYRTGELPEIRFMLHNGSGKPADVSWKLTAYAGSTGKPAATAEGRASLPVGRELPVASKLALDDREPFYRVNCVLTVDGQVVDVASTGLCFWRPEVAAAGPRITFADSYFSLGGRPTFLCGSNQTGVIFASPLENPLVWRRDLRAMADLGLNVLRILHYSPFAMPGDPNLRDRDPEAGLRQLDALIQLAQQAGVVVFLSLHDWVEVELDDTRLAAQREWARTLAARYRGVPGVMFDVQNEPSVAPERYPAALSLWREWLQVRYGSDAALATAWQEPEATIATAEMRGGEGWGSVRAADYERFRVWLLNRWAGENIAGAKQARPDLLCTVGYLPWPGPADQPLGAVHVDFANMHYYGSTADFPGHFKFSDQRAVGKGLSLGEFGIKAHPAWHRANEVGLSESEGVARLLDIAHYCVGLGGSLMANWDWKDMEECIFPWGLHHPGDLVPKDFALAFRNFGLLARLWRPVYRPAPVYLLLADEHRQGAARDEVARAQRAAIDLLLAVQAPFDVIGEGALDCLPTEARAVIYPLPYCPPDAVVERLERYIREGGTLYLSGDVSFDPERRRTRAERLGRLCGVKLVRELAPPLQEAPATSCQGEGIPEYEAHPVLQVEAAGAQVLARGEGGGIIFRHRLGEGQVIFTTDPVELHPQEGGEALYRYSLRLAGVASAIPGLPTGWHAFTQPAADGGRLLLARNLGMRTRQVTFRHLGTSVRMSVRAGGWGLALFGPQGQVRAVEGTGKILVGDTLLLDTREPLMVMQADAQGLRVGGPLVLMPLTAGKVTLSWQPAAAEVGEFIGLAWQARARLTPDKDKPGMLDIAPHRRLYPIIVGEPGQITGAARALQELLAPTPPVSR